MLGLKLNNVDKRGPRKTYLGIDLHYVTAYIISFSQAALLGYKVMKKH